MNYSTRKAQKNEKFLNFRGEELSVGPTDIIIEREDGRAVPCPKEIFDLVFHEIIENANKKTIKKRQKP